MLRSDCNRGRVTGHGKSLRRAHPNLLADIKSAAAPQEPLEADSQQQDDMTGDVTTSESQASRQAIACNIQPPCEAFATQLSPTNMPHVTFAIHLRQPLCTAACRRRRTAACPEPACGDQPADAARAQRASKRKHCSEGCYCITRSPGGECFDR